LPLLQVSCLNTEPVQKRLPDHDFFEYHGAYLNRSAGHETAELSLHCMKKNFAELLPVVSELIVDSIFPEEELDIYKKNMQQRLQVNLRKMIS